MSHPILQNLTSKATLLFILIAFSCCINKTKDNKPEYWEHFIAHAGGAIDGNIYTNCLEALDLSYSKGCKLFELDLVLTTDGKIVAQHDPPEVTEAVFMNRRIAEKYTPLNMEAINLWFQDHPDAILVTDKINDPRRIFNEFSFPDRLLMELFSWEAIDKAIELGIKPMATEELLYKTSHIVKKLKRKKIEYVASSYIFTSEHKRIFKRLKRNGIKTYIFNLEEPMSGQTAEEYVWNHEMKFCYGMYANNCDILESLQKLATK